MGLGRINLGLLLRHWDGAVAETRALSSETLTLTCLSACCINLIQKMGLYSYFAFEFADKSENKQTNKHISYFHWLGNG